MNVKLTGEINMEITIDIPKKSIDQLKSATNSDNKEDAIKKAIDFTNDKY